MTEPIENQRPGADEAGSGWAPPDAPAPRAATQGAVPMRITLPPGLGPLAQPARGVQPAGAHPAAGGGTPVAGAPSYPAAVTQPVGPGGPGAGWSAARPPVPPPAVPPAGADWRMPSGLFPSGPPRPTYREPLPVRRAAVLVGAGAGALWMLLFGLLGSTARAYAWLSVAAGTVLWLAALALARFGDRGVAVGVAVSGAIGVGVTGVVVFVRLLGGHWLLW